MKVKYEDGFSRFVCKVLQDPSVLASFMAMGEYGALRNDELEEALDIQKWGVRHLSRTLAAWNGIVLGQFKHQVKSVPFTCCVKAVYSSMGSP